MPRTAKPKKSSKSNWSDIGDLRRPHAKWRLGGAADWFASVLGLPPDAVAFLLPNGEQADSDEPLGSLRADWEPFMSRKAFGTVSDYAKALRAVINEGVPDKTIELLRAHFEAPNHTATARQLATEVGYPNHNSVNLQYGTFAHRVASELGLADLPKQRFWLFVLVRWARGKDPSSETAFELRPEVVKALMRLGYSWAITTASPAAPALP